MYKNQLQELAQRSCFNLPSYSCIREGPDHAPRFKAKVTFNGEVFESPNFFSTLRQAEHASAEVALRTLSQTGSSRALAAKVLDETGVYKNLLQETAHRAGLNLPFYTTVRSGQGCAPLFTCTVELAGMSFKGEPAKTKKQAQKSAAMAAWFSLKNLSLQDSSGGTSSDEQEQTTVARYLAKFKSSERTQRRKPTKAPVKNDVVPYRVSRHRNYTYQNWHHGMMTLPNYLLSSPLFPSTIPRPHLFPFVQSIFQSGIGPVPLLQSVPFFYMTGDFVPPCTTSSSQVRIEEIEENSPVEEEWLNKDMSLCNREEFNWLPSGFLQNNLGAISVDRPPPQLQNTNYSTMGPKLSLPETSQRNRNTIGRCSARATIGVPRTGGFSMYSARPWPERSRGPCVRAIAPAVQIRSVVPVCSAPAPRSPSPGQGTRLTGESSGDVSAASSEFSRLRM